MTRISRLALIMSCGVSLSACAHGQFILPAMFHKAVAIQPAAKDQISARVWPQTVSDINPDPQVRFGTLPNGMRYGLMHNASPTSQASLRLRFDAGSLMETDAQQGLAHFLEHMAFNGSRHVPEGEMIKILERHGLAFGADTNASTSWGETIYQLDLPKTDDDTVDTSLMLMRETAGELTLAPEAIDRERGVVLSEERTRDAPGYRVYKQGLSFFMKGQLPAERLPIGKVEVLKTATHDMIADYYNKYYRPERAVLVIVGDFDLDQMEAKIKARFSDWVGTGPAGPEPKLEGPAQRRLEAKIAVESGSQTSLQAAWIRPADLSPDSQAQRKKDLIDALGLAVLNRRLEQLARGQDPAFLGAVAYTSDDFKAARSTRLYINLEAGKWHPALDAAQAEVNRIVQYGVLPSELSREITGMRADLIALAARANTRRTPALAGEMIASVDDRTVITSPAEDLAMFEAAVKDLDAKTVSTAIKKGFVGTGPVIFMSSPDAIVGGDGVLAKAFEAALKQPVSAPKVEAETTWPYADFGTPGTVVERKDITDLDTVFVRFANGVRLTVKQTKFSQDQILIRARLGSGLLDLPRDKDTAAWMPGWAATEGGLKALTTEQIDKVLNGKIYGLDMALDDDALVMNGATRPADLDTQLQVLAAFATQPGWRTEGFDRAKTYYGPFNAQLEATPGGVLQRDLEALLHNNDRRWSFPTKAQIAATKAADLRDVLEPALTQGPAEIVVIGDITVDKAIDAVAATFGALPSRTEHTPPTEGFQVNFPKGTTEPVILTHKGRPDQAAGYVAWPTQDFATNPQDARALRILAEVMELRMTDELREKQGATYSPSTNSDSSLVYPGYGFLSASVEMPPAKLAGFFADMDKIAADLRDHPISADELARAKTPRIDAVEKARQTNGYWINILSDAQTSPTRLDAARSVVASLSKVNAADIQRAAQTYLKPDKAWRLKVVPESGK